MNKLILLVNLLLVTGFGFSQTVVWTETFSNGCTAACSGNGYISPNGTWTQTIMGTEGANPNAWYVSCAENNMGAGNCGAGCQAVPNPTLHVSSAIGNSFCPNDCGAAYDAGGLCGLFPPPLGSCPQTDRRIESPTINLTGHSNITLNFLYIEGGQGVTDNATVWYFDGSTWAQLVDEPSTINASCPVGPFGDPQGNWTAYNVALPASANNNPNVKIGFRWVNNDDGAGTDPSFAVDDITLTKPSTVPPVASFNTTNTNLCEGDCISFNNTSTFAPGATFNWDFDGGATNSAAQNPTGICWSTPGTYTVTLTVTDANGTDTEIRTDYILVTAAPNAGADNTLTVCDNTSNFLNTLLSGNDPGGTWAETTAVPSNQFNAVTSEFNSSALPAGNYTFSYTVDGTGPCPDDVATFTVTVTDCAGPAANISASSLTICAGQSIIFNDASAGTNIDTWAWSFGGGTPGTASTAGPHNITFNTPGTFNILLTISDDTGTDDQTIQVTVVPCSSPTAAFAISNNTGVDGTICAGDCLTFTNNTNTTGATSYLWTFTGGNPPSSTSATPGPVCYPTSGSYDVTLVATNAFGSGSYSQTITVLPAPTITVFGDAVTNPGDVVSIGATVTEGTISWSASPASQFANLECTASDCSLADVSPVITTIYAATVTTTEGCTSTETVIVAVNAPSGGFTVGVPTMFSPNDDNQNDVLLVRSFGDKLIAEMVFRVYNRYGQMVFESTDPNDGWDGKFKGDPEAPATFAFTLEYTLVDGTSGELNGNITLVR
jgi:gliding motility-associated-like protein